MKGWPSLETFPCHTSLFLEPCEWEESHMNLISRVFNHSKGTMIHTWVCQEVSNYIEEWKEEAGGANEQMSRPRPQPQRSQSQSHLQLVWYGEFSRRGLVVATCYPCNSAIMHQNWTNLTCTSAVPIHSSYIL